MELYEHQNEIFLVDRSNASKWVDTEGHNEGYFFAEELWKEEVGATQLFFERIQAQGQAPNNKMILTLNN